MARERHKLDDTAAAALWALERGRPAAEHIGLLHRTAAGEVASTPARSRNSGKEARGGFSIPKGSLLGIYHNHPAAGKRDPLRSAFSPTDKTEAARLGVPSYISAGERVYRYDPATRQAEEVLAEFPLEELRKRLRELERVP